MPTPGQSPVGSPLRPRIRIKEAADQGRTRRWYREVVVSQGLISQWYREVVSQGRINSRRKEAVIQGRNQEAVSIRPISRERGLTLLVQLRDLLKDSRT